MQNQPSILGNMRLRIHDITDCRTADDPPASPVHTMRGVRPLQRLGLAAGGSYLHDAQGAHSRVALLDENTMRATMKTPENISGRTQIAQVGSAWNTYDRYTSRSFAMSTQECGYGKAP